MLLSALCLTLASQTGATAQKPATDDASAARTAWLREHAVGLKTVEAGNGFDDLAPLKSMIGDARVVGLGEGTHGTREHFQMKHRLFEFLASEMGFTLFSIEANLPEAYALDTYVLGGEGDVDALIGGMYFWTWNTEEVRALVEWMRAFNAREKAAGSEKRVHFTGFDMQTGTVALQNTIDFLEIYDPEFLEEVRPKLDELATYSPHGAGGNGFGCATGRFPVDAARGKKIRFTGSIKTEGVDAWAGLWWRVDGPTQRFDNMQDRGPRGTLDWQPVELELEVPADAQAIFFGLVMPGEGKAWFDSLAIEVDGKSWADAAFDLDFEAAEPKGLVAADPSGGAGSRDYVAAIDATVAKSGRSSFRLERLPSKGLQAGGRGAARALDRRAHGGRARELRARRRRRAAPTSRSRTRAWSTSGRSSRPIRAAASRRATARWPRTPRGSSGAILARRSCSGRTTGTCATRSRSWARTCGARSGRTTSTSRSAPRTASTTRWPPTAGTSACTRCADPVEGSFESILESDGRPLLLVDLRTAKAGDAGSGWLTESRPFAGIIGALEMPAPYEPAKLQGFFDLLIYTRDTTAARQLASKPRR